MRTLASFWEGKRLGPRTESLLDIKENKEARSVALELPREEEHLLRRLPTTRVPRCARAIGPPFRTWPRLHDAEHSLARSLARARPPACLPARADSAPTRTWLGVFSLGRIPRAAKCTAPFCPPFDSQAHFGSLSVHYLFHFDPLRAEIASRKIRITMKK